MKKTLIFSTVVVVAVAGFSVFNYLQKEKKVESVAVVSTETLASPDKKETAMKLVSSAENSSLAWRDQYAYIEDIKDGRGYTAGIIGFCSGTGDMLELVQEYTEAKKENPLAKFLPALEKVNGTESHEGLGTEFEEAWKKAAEEPEFQKAQDSIRDKIYFNPAVEQAQKDGLSVLGQFVYYDAIVMHGPGDGSVPLDQSFYGIRETTMKEAKTPAEGGQEDEYLMAFFKERGRVMGLEEAHADLSRIEAQEKFLKEKNLTLTLPLTWTMYGQEFELKK